MKECYECGRKSLELNKYSRCINCATNALEFNMAENDDLRNSLYSALEMLQSLCRNPSEANRAKATKLLVSYGYEQSSVEGKVE